MGNKIVFGLENVYIALLTEATGVYGIPEAVPGAMNLTLDPEGELAKVFADNITYATAEANNGYNAELEEALFSDAILASILGWEVDEDTGLVEVLDGTKKPFALLFQIQGDSANRRHVLYKCVASRPSQEHATKGDSVEAATTTLPIAVMPTTIDGRVVVKKSLTRSDNTTVYDAWYTAVVEPNFGVS
jgi:phi13 family phage major tail protein